MVPVIALGLFDRDVSDHMLPRYPQLYLTSLQSKQVNTFYFY